MDTQISLPKNFLWELDEDTPHKGRAIISPCYPGYGVTLGNSIRRVMLSSLSGAAAYAVKIRSIQHEFSTLENVKEDVAEIILRLKRLRLKLFSEQEVKLILKAKGEKKIYAKDIEPNAQVEIANPDLHIATLTDPSASFDADIWAKKGIGYVPTENMEGKENLEVGAIALDSIFTPIRNVGFDISNVRVGGRTDFDKLTMEIETDGTITIQEAFEKTVDILLSHFNFIKENASPKEEKNFRQEEGA